MKTAIITALAALALAAPAAADPGPGHYITVPNSMTTLEPFHIYGVVDCIGEVAVFDQAENKFPIPAAWTNRNGFVFDDGHGPVYYDDTAMQFVNHSSEPVIVAKWCSTVTSGSTVTPPPAPAPAPVVDEAPEPTPVDYQPVAETPDYAPAPAVRRPVQKRAAKRYKVRRCHVSKRTHQRACFTARVTRSHLSRAERKRLHLR